LRRYISTPKALVDTTIHYRPVGAYEFALWQKGLPLPTPIERYRNDPGALKLISQDQWTLDRPLYDIKATNTVVGAESDYFVQAQRRQNFYRRMIPHIFGWFTMAAAWVIIIVHLEWAKHDLSKLSDISIPGWVDGVIYGTVLIVSKNAINPTNAPTHAPRSRSSTALVAVLELHVCAPMRDSNPLKHPRVASCNVPPPHSRLCPASWQPQIIFQCETLHFRTY
jgi:hypothetical protein